MSVLVVAMLAAVAFVPVILAAQTAKPEDAVLATVQTFVQAIETADLQLISSTFDQDATAFMPGGGLNAQPERRTGKTQIAESFGALFARVRAQGTGPRYSTITPRDVMTQIYGDIAIVTLHLRDVPVQPVREAIPFPRRTVRVTSHRGSLADRAPARVDRSANSNTGEVTPR